MKEHNHRYASLNFNWLIILLAVIALFSGGILYVLWRPNLPLFLTWLKFIELDGCFLSARQQFALYGQFIPEWLLFSLPSALWAFSYAIIITGIWWQSLSRLKTFWLATILILPVGWEFLQYMSWISGTFAFGDVIAGVTGAVLGFLIGIKST